ncbi:hypothetical protein AB7M29_003373 [Pseudomonas sp. F-14 TE3623]
MASSRASPLPHLNVGVCGIYAQQKSTVGAGLLAKAPDQTPQNLQTKKSPISFETGLFHLTPDQAAGSSSALAVILAVVGTTA